MQRSHRILSCCMAVMLLAVGACASGPKIRSFEQEGADLSRYRTFGFYEPPAGDAQKSAVAQFIKAAINREMQNRGYQHIGDEPDLLVNFHLQTEDKETVSTSPASYFGWRGGYHWAANPVRDDAITSYTKGTLNVDIIDRSRNELVWESVAIGIIKEESLENPEPAINAVMAQMFERYPLPTRAAQPSTGPAK
jgi:hypothetical protein